LRIHDTMDSEFYLQVSSGPVIESCDRIRVAPLEHESTESLASPATTANRWNEVQDFDWMKPEPSPHWRVLSVGERRRVDVIIGGGE